MQIKIDYLQLNSEVFVNNKILRENGLYLMGLLMQYGLKI